ncbi:MAG: choice-of-anchor D domain-containing protein [Rubricoccaceae bacterium]
MRFATLLLIAWLALILTPQVSAQQKGGKVDTYVLTPAGPAAPATAALNTLLNESFEGTADGEIPPGWTRLNVNNDNRQWIVATASGNAAGRARTGTKYAVVFWNETAPANDWLFTPGLALQSGRTYRISFGFKPGDPGFGTSENLRVRIGPAATVEGMTTTLFERLNEPAGPYIDASVEFTATTTADHFIGFHCFSGADEYFCAIDDVVVQEVVAGPAISVNPAAVAFGNVAIGGSATRTVTITNSGGEDLTIAGATLSGSSAFSIEGAVPGTIAPGANAPVTIRFSPTAAGPASGTLTITSNAASSPTTVALSGAGLVATTFSGTTAGGQTWQRPLNAGTGASGSCTLSGAATAVPYRAIPITVSEAGEYEVLAAWEGFDGYLLLYRGAFAPADQCLNLIGLNDDFGGIAASRILTTLEPGAYVIVATGFGNADAGPYQITVSGPAAVTGGGTSAEEGAQGAFALAPARPNPATTTATVTLEVALAEQVRVDLFDALGRRVATLFEGVATPGRHPLAIRTEALPAGTYLIRATGESFAQTQRLAVVR